MVYGVLPVSFASGEHYLILFSSHKQYETELVSMVKYMETTHQDSHDFLHSQQTQSMTNKRLASIGNIAPERASRMVGLSWVLMFILAIPTVLFGLEQLVVKGDPTASLENISGHELLLYLSIASYFVILSLDATIAIGLYSILKYTNKKIALLQSMLRLAFVLTTTISLIGLAFLQISFYSTGVLVGYLFLIPHLCLVGYLTIRSWYLSKALGVFMVLASFSYVITMFGVYFLSTSLYTTLYSIAMIPASLAEISLGIYLIIRARTIDERIDY